jgi:hypothetical protein
MQVGDLVQRFADCASGVEPGRDEPHERCAAAWRFVAFPARFGRELLSLILGEPPDSAAAFASAIEPWPLFWFSSKSRVELSGIRVWTTRNVAASAPIERPSSKRTAYLLATL